MLDEQPLYEFPRNDEVFASVVASVEAVLGEGVEDRVRRLDVPLLALQGSADGPERARRVAELAPHGEWAEIADAGHVPWLEQPAALRDGLRAFLGGIAARAA